MTWNSAERKTKQLENGGKRIMWLVDLPGDVIQVYELGLARLTTEWRHVKGLTSILDSSILCTWFNIMTDFFTICCEGKIKFKICLCPLWGIWLASNPYWPRKVTNVLNTEGTEELHKFLGIWKKYYTSSSKLHVSFNIYIYIYIYIYI